MRAPHTGALEFLLHTLYNCKSVYSNCRKITGQQLFDEALLEGVDVVVPDFEKERRARIQSEKVWKSHPLTSPPLLSCCIFDFVYILNFFDISTEINWLTFIIPKKIFSRKVFVSVVVVTQIFLKNSSRQEWKNKVEFEVCSRIFGGPVNKNHQNNVKTSFIL